MIRLSVCFVLLTALFCSYAQTTQIIPIPVDRIPDSPQGYVTFMYEELNFYLEDPDVNANNIKLLNYKISSDFANTTKPYLVVFSNQHTQAMVEEQTEKLLKKWDFENNYPYCYLLILSNYPPKIVFGKHLTGGEAQSKIMSLSVETIWKSGLTPYMKLSEIIKNLKTLNFDKNTVPTQDYLSQWDKQHFFNYGKTVSEKEERYLNKLLEETYQKNNLRFWILSGTTSKNKEILPELLQKTDFNTHSNQGIIVLNTDSYGLSIILTKDLQSKWSTGAENQVRQTAQFYFDKGWYYDAIKESFLMTKEELLYNNTAIRQQEEQVRSAEVFANSKMYAATIKIHKLLFWIIAIFLLIPLFWAKKYLEKNFSGHSEKKLSDMKVVLGTGYAVILIITGLYIVNNTPLFYSDNKFLIAISSPLLCMITYFGIIMALYHKKIIGRPESVKILFLVTTLLYITCVTGAYLFTTYHEWIRPSVSFGKDFFNMILLGFLSNYIVNRFAKKQNSFTPASSMSYKNTGEISSRKGFGKRQYVSKYNASRQ